MSGGRWIIERLGRRVLEARPGAGAMGVGADRGNAIVLDEPGIAPQAATLEVDDEGRPWVRCPPSAPLEALRTGASIEVGTYTIAFEPPTSSVRVKGTRNLGDRGGEAGPLRLVLPRGALELSPGGPVSIGRDDDNDVVVDADVISGYHCELSVAGGAWRVRDLGSTNGTFLDGVRVTQANLPRAGVLVLGDLEVRFGPAAPSSLVDDFHGLVGRSAAMQAVFRKIEVVARLEEPVLVLGETGTGKELVASALHSASSRAKKRFLARNCGAIPESLAEAELFGSVPGAFSQATNKPGVFEGAAGGTVFLDELGELPLSVQPKLLRAIQEKKVQRLGALEEKRVDFRLVAATHRDLRAMAAEGGFREDLFHRMSVFTIEIPPLRDRRDDIPLLAEHLLDGAGVELTGAARDRLVAHAWPGNVRELRNCLIRASAFRTGDRIDAGDLDLEPAPARAAPARAAPSAPARARRPRRRAVSLDDDAVREETLRVWEACGRSVSRAAETLGIAKSTMHRRKEIYGLPEPDA